MPNKLKLVFILIAAFLAYWFLGYVNFYRWQGQRRELFLRLLGARFAQKLDQRSIQEIAEDKVEDNVIRKKIIFTSSYEEQIPCFLFYRPSERKQPAILITSGHGEGIVETAGLTESYQHGNALYLAQHGFVTLSCENRGQGLLRYKREVSGKSLEKLIDLTQSDNWKRLENTDPDTLLPPEDVPTFLGHTSYMGLLLEDQRRAIDYLQTLPVVDAERIGAAGISMGGELAFYLAAVDQRVKSVVVMGWLTSWLQLQDDKPDWKIPQIDQHFSSMADIGALLPPRYSLFHNGLLESKLIVGVGFPADIAQLISQEIREYYVTALVPSRTEFYSLNVEHEFINDLATDFFNRTLKAPQSLSFWSWLQKEPRLLAKHFVRKHYIITLEPKTL